MSRKSVLVVIYMCLSLLFIQWSGLHFHVNMGDEVNALHTTHVHGIGSHDHHNDHNHESDIDVSLFELGTNWFKQIQYAIVLTVALILAVTSVIVVWPPPFQSQFYSRFAYWRPILRGPPTLH